MKDITWEQERAIKDQVRAHIEENFFSEGLGKAVIEAAEKAAMGAIQEVIAMAQRKAEALAKELSQT